MCMNVHRRACAHLRRSCVFQDVAVNVEPLLRFANCDVYADMSANTGVDMSVDMLVDICVDMRVDMGVDMLVDMCVDMHVDMCVDMRVDMCVDMHVDMCVDMRVDLQLLVGDLVVHLLRPPLEHLLKSLKAQRSKEHSNRTFRSNI